MLTTFPIVAVYDENVLYVEVIRVKLTLELLVLLDKGLLDGF
jgi:hypothetical protein